MKDDILAQISAYKAPEQLPPIADTAFLLYASGGFALSEDALGVLRRDLEALGDDLKALTDAICGLGAFALYLRDIRNDPTSADAVAKLITEHAPKYASIGERLVAALQDIASKATDLLDRFSDRDASFKSKAPKVGAQQPLGTIPLKAIKPMKKLEPSAEAEKKKKKTKKKG